MGFLLSNYLAACLNRPENHFFQSPLEGELLSLYHHTLPFIISFPMKSLIHSWVRVLTLTHHMGEGERNYIYN
jgi:hypothetical protein